MRTQQWNVNKPFPRLSRSRRTFLWVRSVAVRTVRKGKIQRKGRVVNLHELLLRILPEWDGVHLVRRVREWYLRARDLTRRVPKLPRRHLEQQRQQLVLGLCGW